MVKSGLTSQNAFGASAAGSKSNHNSSNRIGTTKSAITPMNTSLSDHSYKSSSGYNVFIGPSPKSLTVGFNSYSCRVESYSYKSINFQGTTRSLIANRNEREHAHYANDQNWKMMKRKLSSSAFPAPSMEYSRSYDLQKRYQNFRTLYEARGEDIHVRFESQRQRIRATGVTLEGSFNNRSSEISQSTTQVQTKETVRESRIERRAYTRWTMNFQGSSQTQSKGRGRK